MTNWIRRKMKGGIGPRAGISRRLSQFVLLGLVLAVICACISCRSRSGEKTIPKKVRVYPQQEVLIEYCEAMLMGRVEDALSSTTSDWPEKDEFIAAAKSRSEEIEYLAFTIGPVETFEWDTLDEARMVLVTSPSKTIRSRSTGKIKTTPSPEDPPRKIPWLVEKQGTTDGPRWFLLAEPRRFSAFAIMWLDQPRKIVADSATIALKKDVTKKEIVVQTLADGEVVSERKIPYDE